MNWKDLKVQTKIMICFMVPLILMGGLGIWIYQSSHSIFNAAEHMRDESVVFEGIAQQMGKDVIQIQQWLTDISATRGLDGLNDGFDEAEKSYQSFLSGLDRFETMFERDNDNEALQRTQELRKRAGNYYEMGKKMANGYIEGGPEAGNIIMADFDGAAEELSSALEPFVQEQISELGMMTGNIITSVGNLKSGVLIVFLLLFAIVIVSGIFLTRSVTRPLNKAMGLTHALAEGDLTMQVNLNRKDEFGQLLLAEKTMVDNLKKIVLQIIGVASTVASSSEELSATTEQISAGISEQSNQLEQSSAATAEVSQTITEVANKAVEASVSVNESVTIAKNGKNVVEQTVSSMRNIAENVQQSSKTIGELGESSKKIGDIISVINDIASQTNLLALNAAIEAARAGEQGRGFAVVADEVRKLAEKTSHATEEITSMINKIQRDTELSVQSMDKNMAEAQSGVLLANQAKESLDKIVHASDMCLDQVNSIATATEQQSAAVEEVSSSIENIANAFVTSRGAVSQISSSAVDLAKISGELMTLVSWFKIDAHSSKNSTTHASHDMTSNNKYKQGMNSVSVHS